MNLLPPSQKKRIKKIKFYRNIISSGLLLILAVLVLIVLSAGTLVFLYYNLWKTENKINYEQSKIIQKETVKSMEKRVGDFNRVLGKMSLLSEKRSVYDTLQYFSESLLKNVTVQNISIDNQNMVQVVGFAQTRAELIEIKNILENSSEFTQIDFPIANLTNPYNIDFRFGFKYLSQKTK